MGPFSKYRRSSLTATRVIFRADRCVTPYKHRCYGLGVRLESGNRPSCMIVDNSVEHPVRPQVAARDQGSLSGGSTVPNSLKFPCGKSPVDDLGVSGHIRG